MKLQHITESGYIVDPKDFDPRNIVVMVNGYGELTLHQLKQKIKQHFEQLAAKADVATAASLESQFRLSPLPGMIQAYVDVEDQLATPQMKRKATISRKKQQKLREHSAHSYAAVAKHIAEGVSFTNSMFRYRSDAYFDTINLARTLYKTGLLETDEHSAELLESDCGIAVTLKGAGKVYLDTPYEAQPLSEAEYKGRDVELNKPKRGGSKKFYVYVKDPTTNTVKKVSFGAKDGGGNLAVKLKDPQARKAYDSRHGCSDGRHNDKTKPGYWSCRLPRFAKALGLAGSGEWW